MPILKRSSSWLSSPKLKPFRRVESKVAESSKTQLDFASGIEIANSAVINDPESVEALDQLGAALEHSGRFADALRVYRYRLNIKQSDAILNQVNALVSKTKSNDFEPLHVSDFAFDPMCAFTLSLRRALKDY